MKKKMLITGVSGLLGNNLAYYFKDIHDVSGWYSSHEVDIKGAATRKLNISYEDSLEDVISGYNPDVLIHCASLTDVDFCEKHKELTNLVNIVDTRRMIQACLNPKTKFVYISTDSVYDGEKGNFKETDSIDPCNHYGISKYEGERAVIERENSLVLRTNIFGWNIQEKCSIAEWVLRNLSQKRPIQGFKDVYFSSIYTFKFARVLETILKKDLKGVYNCASGTSLSKYEFACSVAERLGLDKNLIKPISIDDSNLTAKRGKNLSLNVDKLSGELGENLPSLEESLDAFCQDYKDGEFPVRDCRSLTVPDWELSGWYPKTSKLIPYGRQSIDVEDINAVIDVLKSPMLTQGDNVSQFEKALCEYVDSRFAVLFNSGTSALHAACLALGVQSGDEVITSPNTFVASANAAAYCGAKPVFADIDAKTYNIDPVGIEGKITFCTKAVIPVHFAGQSCEMETIKQIVQQKEKRYKKKIYIIEDACHALGSYYKGHKVGSGKYSDMTVMSFHPVKHITTGEGGVVFTNSEELFKKLKLFRSHGITNTSEDLIYKDRAFTRDGLLNLGYYEQQLLGFNYRITDVQCALGLSQLKKLPFFIKRRKEIMDFYNRSFKDNEFIQIPYESPNCASNWHLYVLNLDFEKIGISRTQFAKNLREKGIQTQVHYIPVHTQPFYMKNFNTNWGDCPTAEAYYKKCLSIPLFPAMMDEEATKVVAEITASFPPLKKGVRGI
ncbi:MAG: UDP-4-amino-4,6-dideoxy-N-acetyl-beta-L-altrosamine transaminase [Candidatus Omnitrophota bacterium]